MIDKTSTVGMEISEPLVYGEQHQVSEDLSFAIAAGEAKSVSCRPPRDTVHPLVCTYYLFCTEVGVPRGSEQNSPPSTVSGRHAYSLYNFVARKTDNCMYSVCSLQIIQMKVTEMFSITLAKQIRYDGGWDPYLPTSVLAEIDHLRELQFISCGTLMKYIETTIR